MLIKKKNIWISRVFNQQNRKILKFIKIFKKIVIRQKKYEKGARNDDDDTKKKVEW